MAWDLNARRELPQAIMNGYFSLATVFVSGAFALVVAMATAHLTARREAWQSKRIFEKERYDEFRDLFSRQLAIFEKAIRLTHRLEDYSVLNDEMVLANAQLLLTGKLPIIKQSEKVGDLLHEWSTEYRSGSHFQSRESKVAHFTPSQKSHHENAMAVYPKLNQEILDLAALMRKELELIGHPPNAC